MLKFICFNCTSWPHRLVARTTDSHSANQGSIPCGVTNMIESCLNLNKEYPWYPGIRQDYGIVKEDGEAIGKLSITRFSVEKPFVTKWIYLNDLKIPDLKNRGQGFAYRAMLKINELIESEGANGVLKNSIIEKNKHDFYQKLGWNKVPGLAGPWEFLMTQPLSNFLVRDVVDNVIKANFVK